MLRGPVHGALVGLLAGWVVQLVPPVGSPLGLTPLVMMVAGLVAGSFAARPPAPDCVPRPRCSPRLPSCSSDTSVRRAGRGGVEPADELWRLVATVAVGGLLLPPLLALDRALVRRRLG